MRPQTRLVARHGAQVLVRPEIPHHGRTGKAENVGEVDRLGDVGRGVGAVEQGDGPSAVGQLADQRSESRLVRSYSNAWLLLKIGLPTSPAFRNASTSWFWKMWALSPMVST